ncbi:hypothetical protein RhiirA5_439727 [Rhizophagus irregularis]|uniref:HAT C-terminal dimerisation domain-containing protein n=2 Tax=Rhizophagus irregularis TaxID=588596 RepID=A0A2N0NHH6_9GLOM|nr:hypothetical protein RhiirA5_439727 [Rhizophagus irregularis]
MFESADSIWRLKLALEKVANENSNIITSKSVLKSINARGFFHNVNLLLKVLDPLKKTVLSVEASNTNYADCFIALIRLANAIKQIPVERDLVGFRNYAIDSINRRWESFDNMPFILTYFLHPGYRGEGLKQGMWTKISAYAQDIWKNMGYDINDQEILIAQMLNFKDKQGTYAVPFVKKCVMPRTWWMSCDDQPPYLKQLALKMFSVVPHSASCERMFSALGWLYGKKRTTLDINTVEAMAKIRHFYQNNSKLISSEKTHTDNEVQKMVNESFFFDEVDYNEDNNNEDGYEEIFETQIPNHEVYVLIEDNVDLTNAIFLNNEEEEEDEIYN